MKITKKIKLCLMLAPMVNFWGCTMHKISGMNPDKNILPICTKIEGKIGGGIGVVGGEAKVTKIIPCPQKDCPAKIYGFDNKTTDSNKGKWFW